MKEISVAQKQELLDKYIGKKVSLTCQVGVCIWGEMFTLEPGHGLCMYDLTRDGMRIGISPHIVHALEEKLDKTLSITVS